MSKTYIIKHFDFKKHKRPVDKILLSKCISSDKPFIIQTPWIKNPEVTT